MWSIYAKKSLNYSKHNSKSTSWSDTVATLSCHSQTRSSSRSPPAGRRPLCSGWPPRSSLLASPRSAAAAFLVPHIPPRFAAALVEPASSRKVRFFLRRHRRCLVAKMVLDLRAKLFSCRSPSHRPRSSSRRFLPTAGAPPYSCPFPPRSRCSYSESRIPQRAELNWSGI
jgi:hypothetical protein